MSLVRFDGRPQQAQIALAPAATIGPHLPGTARRAAHFMLIIDRHIL
jgi:hypothetical protein